MNDRRRSIPDGTGEKAFSRRQSWHLCGVIATQWFNRTGSLSSDFQDCGPIARDLGASEHELSLAAVTASRWGYCNNSFLAERIKAPTGPLRMPPLASSVVDTFGAQLIDAWIASLPSCKTLPTALATNQAHPAGLTIDRSNLYWVNRKENSPTATFPNYFGTVRSVPLGGGALPPPIASNQHDPVSISVAGGVLHWGNYGSGTVMRKALAGTSPEVQLASGQTNVVGVVADSSAAYWLTYPTFTSSAVWKLPVTSTAPISIASALPGLSNLALTSTGLYWTFGGTSPDYVDGSLNMTPQGSAVPATLVSGITRPGVLAIRDGVAYWGSFAGTTSRMVLGTTNVVPVASGQGNVYGIAVDGTSIYWSTYTDVPPYTAGKIMTAPLLGGAATEMVSGIPAVASIAVDDDFIYWTTQGTSTNNYLDGTLMKLAK